MAARDELVAAIAGRYAQGDRAERGRILDEFAAVTGFHRKHAMRLLRAGRVTRRCGPRLGRRVYGEAVREALIVVWEASDRICGKRLRPLLPILVEAAPSTCSIGVTEFASPAMGSKNLLPTHTADFGPDLEFFGPGSSVLGGSDMIAAKVEEVIDLIMG
jgi:hypothetical protein